MKVHHIQSTFTEYSNVEDLPSEDQHLLMAAIRALDTSYSPYSLFRVGAAAITDGGNVVEGSNQENAAFPSGLCAERVALFAMGAANPQSVIQTLAVVADTMRFELTEPVTPCGACRQVISEYELKQGSPIRILLHHIKGSTWVFNGIEALLPLGFKENKLKRNPSIPTNL